MKNYYVIFTSCLIIFCLFSINIFGQKTWTGNINNDWTNADNWNPTGIPTSQDEVTIPSTANLPIIPNDTTRLKSLEIQSGVTLTIPTDAVLLLNEATNDALTIHGQLTNLGKLIIGNTIAPQGNAITNKGTFINGADICSGFLYIASNNDVVNTDSFINNGTLNFQSTGTLSMTFNNGQITLPII
ncbi:MAG: hypothetical protein AB8G86_21910 [Saprospiraceae bacterium]